MGLPLSQRARVALLGVAGAVMAFFVFGGLRGTSSTAVPLDAVPEDSFLVATMHVAELRRSPLYEVLLGKESGQPAKQPSVIDARALGIAKLGEACGFDPLTRVESLAVAVPEEGDRGELGLAARVTVTRDELSRCTAALAGHRGGKVETREVGSFVVVEDTRSQGPGRPRLAYGRGGLLVAGRGAWFDAMLATADGKRPGVRHAEAHTAIRSSLTRKDGWSAPTLVASALIPRSLRDRIKREMGAELGAKDDSQAVMAGVLGVSTVGLALRAGTSGQRIDAAVELGCDGPSGEGRPHGGEDACAAVEKLISSKRLEWSKELTLRMVGFGPLLDSIEVRREGALIRVTAGAPADALASTLERVLRLSTGRGGPAERQDRRREPGDAAARAPIPGKPDETIAAPRPSSVPLKHP